MASNPKKKKSDDAAKAAAKTAFNTAVPEGRRNPGPAAKKAPSWDKTYRSLSNNSGGINAPNTFTEGNKPKAKPKAGGARPETPGAYPAKSASPAPKPKAKPAREAPKAAAAPMKKASSSAPAYSPPKAEKRVGGKTTSGFSGNWVGAAPTAMQARGGAKISRGGGLLGKLKKR